MATHSSLPAWRIPWAEEPGGRRPRGQKGPDTTEHANVLAAEPLGLRACYQKTEKNQHWPRGRKKRIFLKYLFIWVSVAPRRVLVP